jgi:hypothetical protein
LSDTNLTRERYSLNKKAFTDVLGDPWAYPEQVEGYYNILKRRSTISATGPLGEASTTLNAAKPSPVDFLCDVENIISRSMDKELLNLFIETYIISANGTSTLTQQERTKLEQRLGRLFLAYGISPVAKYFTAIRKPIFKQRACRKLFL